MKSASLLSILFFLFVSTSFSNNGNNKTIDVAIKEQATQWIQKQPVKFLENKGQMTDMDGNPVPFVLFKAESPNMNMYIGCVVNQSPSVTTGHDVTICSGNSTTLNVGGGIWFFQTLPTLF